MKKILKGNISIVEKVLDWKEGVKKAGEILLKNDSIEERYIEAAIKNIEKLGTYIVLTDYVAMPHARPEEGAKKTDISLLVVRDGVDFSDEEVKLIFMLASKDNSSHIEVISKLSSLIDDEELIEKIYLSETKEQILNLL